MLQYYYCARRFCICVTSSYISVSLARLLFAYHSGCTGVTVGARGAAEPAALLLIVLRPVSCLTFVASFHMIVEYIVDLLRSLTLHAQNQRDKTGSHVSGRGTAFPEVSYVT